MGTQVRRKKKIKLKCHLNLILSSDFGPVESLCVTFHFRVMHLIRVFCLVSVHIDSSVQMLLHLFIYLFIYLFILMNEN